MSSVWSPVLVTITKTRKNYLRFQQFTVTLFGFRLTHSRPQIRGQATPTTFKTAMVIRISGFVLCAPVSAPPAHAKQKGEYGATLTIHGFVIHTACNTSCQQLVAHSGGKSLSGIHSVGVTALQPT